MTRGRKQQRQPTPREYVEARAQAQQKANHFGLDHGLEWNSLMGEFHVWMLPRRENRRGHELRCEVVSPENLAKCLPGHGPGPLANGWTHR